MNSTVWKFSCPLQGRFSLSLPAGAVPLSVGVQQLSPMGDEGLVLWALVDPDEEARETRWFAVCGTGHPTAPPDAAGFIGTAQMAILGLVWHIFYLGEA